MIFISLLGASITDHLQAIDPQVAVLLLTGLFLLTTFDLLLCCFRLVADGAAHRNCVSDVAGKLDLLAG